MRDDDDTGLSMNVYCVIAKDNSDIFYSGFEEETYGQSFSWISPELYGRTMREEIHKIVNNYQDCC